MLLDGDVSRALQRERFVRLFERILMRFDTAERLRAVPDTVGRRFKIEPWADYYQDDAAALIAAAYEGHIDSRINDQYQSLTGARRFLNNIVQFPGCGSFFRPASFVAFDRQTRWLTGLLLASFISPSVGHITQICVAPDARGSGLGYALLDQAISVMRQNGACRVSLTVTAANTHAVNLYRRCGFEEVRRFFAHVWEGY